MAAIEDFNKLDARVGVIMEVEKLSNAKHTTHKLVIDFGNEIGEKVSCARVINYKDKDLIGKKILGVVNFPPRQIGKVISESLTLGVPGVDGEVSLVIPDKEANIGGRLY
ncbi:MAG: tRNA-binding protein [Nanoarchaeota archaeon]|nr:tRNA-binding protein [Nanoarchaeota archaeon]